VARRGREALRMRDGYLRGQLSRPATQRQMDVLAAYVAAGGSVQGAAESVGIRPSTVKRHLADLRARSGLTVESATARRLDIVGCRATPISVRRCPGAARGRRG
jgi:DNA-binding NarL/FixJ family response regulator